MPCDKYKVLKFICKHDAPVPADDLSARFGNLRFLSVWCDPSPGYLQYHGEDRLYPGSPESYEITETGVEYVLSEKRRRRSVFLSCLFALLGAALGAVLPALLF